MSNSKRMSTRTFSGTFPSPETPPSGEDGPGIGILKGWSSERIPRSTCRSRRHVASAALMPFSSGRTLPSKWEDAERWICSPVSLGNASTNSNCCYYGTVGSAGPKKASHLSQHQRRAKSKSGPLGPVGPGYYTSGYNGFSPVLGVGVINEEKWRNTLASESPGLSSARFGERLGAKGEGGGNGGGGASEGGRRSCPGHDTTNWLDSWSGPPSPTQGEVNFSDENNEEGNTEEEKCKNARVERAVSRRDMATQMFSESENESIGHCSAVSSLKSSVSAAFPRPQLLNKGEPEPEPEPEPKKDVQSSEFEVRDVQVDKQASSTRSRPHAHNVREDGSSISTTSIVNGADSQISKCHREEARINAWENLQKAKAESAIQKLEEKLEKKRESSMSKIIQRLRRAENKARTMRSSISSGSDKTESRAIPKTTSNPSFYKKIRLFSLSRNCATCFPF